VIRKNNKNQSLLDIVLKKLVEFIRKINNKNQQTSFLIIDSQSVKNTNTPREKGYDAGKKVSGIKRHIAVDSNELPHAIEITTADINDRSGAIKMIDNNKKNLSKVQAILGDGGYTWNKFADKMKDILGCEVEITKRSELYKFVVLPNRWIVERSFAWINNCRRLWKNCERKLESSLGMLQLAFVKLLLKRV